METTHAWPNGTGFEIAGLRIVVTGAGGGIGSAAALLAARMGARVVAADLQPPDELVAVAREHGGAMEAAECDNSNRASVERLFQLSGPIDALIDAAGICPYDDWTSEVWNQNLDEVLAVNLRGPINLVRSAMSNMEKQGKGGRIVLAGSLAGRMGGLRSGAHYAAAKGGIHALVRWFSQRATAKGILVNAVAPGTTDTPMTAGKGYDPSAYPLGRFAHPEEIAAVMLFLCMPASSFISGAILDVNGGIYFS